MKRSIVAMILTAMVVMIAVSTARTAPKPAAVPVSWQLDIHYEDPQPIELTLPGETFPRRYWYVRYTVTNGTGTERIFVPEFTLYADTGQVLRSGQRVPLSVFKAVKKRHNDPLLKDMTGMTGRLLQGDDNAKDGVAIWEDIDPAAGIFDIFINGLSGETAEVKLPSPIKVNEIDARGNDRLVVKDKLILSKALMLRYALLGEAAARMHTPPKLQKQEWVMR
jgi:hypothetical protein